MFRKILHATILAIGASSIVFTPAAKAQQSDALAQLDEQLPGTLVNDPTRIDWESYGADMNASGYQDDSVPGGGAARRFEITRADEFIYAAGTNIPLVERVDRGDTITIGFWARALEARTDDGRGVLRVRFQEDAPPYSGFGEETLSIGNEWEWYEVTAEAEQTLRSKDGIIALQFGRTRQILEIGQAIVVSGVDRISAEKPVYSATTPQESNVVTDFAIAELPDPLKGSGTLINNPVQDAWKFSGTAGSFEQLDDSEIWLAKSTRFTIAEEQSALTDLMAIVPIQQAIQKDDELLIAIAARTISSSSDDGRAIAASRIQATVEPFDTFSSNRWRVGDSWQLIRIRTKAPRDFAPGEAELALFFGGTVQEVEVGPAYVLKTN